MTRRMTREEVRAWKTRWEMVNEAEIEELRAASPALKFRQLAALMASVGPAGWTEALAAEEAEVRARWIKLKKVCGV